MCVRVCVCMYVRVYWQSPMGNRASGCVECKQRFYVLRHLPFLIAAAFRTFTAANEPRLRRSDLWLSHTHTHTHTLAYTHRVDHTLLLMYFVIYSGNIVAGLSSHPLRPLAACFMLHILCNLYTKNCNNINCNNNNESHN